jgi:Domain of unknown function (DUF4340)
MRFRNTLIALAVLLIIGGYAFVNFYFSKPAQAKIALNIKGDDIAKIDLKYPDRELVLERKAGEPWMITKPLGTQADQTAASNLARAIAQCEITKTVEEKAENLAPFGLDKPQVTVTVTDTRGKTLPGLQVGKLTPVGFSAYLKYTDKPVIMLTSSAFPSGMNKTVDQMRDRELMSFKVDDVQTLVITHDDGTEIAIDRDGDKWKIVKPASYDADPTQVRQILTTLGDSKVADFITDAPRNAAQYGLEKPHLTATVYLAKGGEQESLLFGFKQKESGKDGIYVRRGERAPIYTVAPWVMSGVDKSVLNLRDRTVLTFDASKVETITLNPIDKPQFVIKRAEGGKWNVVGDSKTSPADVSVVERFMDQIRDLKGNSIIMDPLKSPEMFGMDKPALVVTLQDKDGREVGQLRLSKMEVKPAPPAGSSEPPSSSAHTEYYAASSAGAALFSTDDFLFSQLNKTADQFRAKESPSPAATPGK